MFAGAVPSKPFRLRTIVTKGQGLAKPREWAEIRELIQAKVETAVIAVDTDILVYSMRPTRRSTRGL